MDHQTKRCSRCYRVRPFDCFGADKRASDGKQSACRECCNARYKQRYWERPEAFRRRQTAYYHEHKERISALSAVARAKNAELIHARKRQEYERVKATERYQQARREYARKTRQQKREYDRQYRAENAERLAAIKAVWRSKNAGLIRAVRNSYKARRRAIEKTGDSTAEILSWERGAKKQCYWCGARCQDRYHIDHYHPLAKGGKHEIANLVIACPRCNVRKNAKDPYEFAVSVGRLF